MQSLSPLVSAKIYNPNLYFAVIHSHQTLTTSQHRFSFLSPTPWLLLLAVSLTSSVTIECNFYYKSSSDVTCSMQLLGTLLPCSPSSYQIDLQYSLTSTSGFRDGWDTLRNLTIQGGAKLGVQLWVQKIVYFIIIY